MIKEIVHYGNDLRIDGRPNYPSFYNQTPSSGLVRYNGNSQSIEIYDGSYWVPLTPQVVSIGFSEETTMALAWAKKQAAKEKEYIELAKSHPAINSALDKFNQAKEQLEVTIHLSKNNETQSTS